MNSEAGQTTTEYGLILVVFSIAVIVVLGVIAGSVSDLFTDTEAIIRTEIDKVFA
jgi:Flp pilus assembly pilin Flp